MIDRTLKKQAGVGVVGLLGLLGATLAAASGWQTGAGEDWRKALEAARSEGEVVVAGPSRLGDEFADAFERDTGIRLSYIGGSNRDIRTRFRREASGNVTTIDVKIGGHGEVSMLDDGMFQPIAPHLLLPSVTDPSQWLDGRLKWVDSQWGYLPIPNEYLFGWPVVNTDQAAGLGVSQWSDLLKPELKGRIVVWDPRSPGPGQAAVSYLGHALGKDFLAKLLVDQKAVLYRDGRKMVEAVVRGDAVVAIGAIAPHVEKFRDAGMTQLTVPRFPDAPGALVGGSSIPVLPKNPPHPNAATVFVNWYLGQPGQEIFARIWQTPSRRADVSRQGLPAYVIPETGFDYEDQYTPEWYAAMRNNWEPFLVDLLGN